MKSLPKVRGQTSETVGGIFTKVRDVWAQASQNCRFGSLPVSPCGIQRTFCDAEAENNKNKGCDETETFQCGAYNQRMDWHLTGVYEPHVHAEINAWRPRRDA